MPLTRVIAAAAIAVSLLGCSATDSSRGLVLSTTDTRGADALDRPDTRATPASDAQGRRSNSEASSRWRQTAMRLRSATSTSPIRLGSGGHHSNVTSNETPWIHTVLVSESRFGMMYRMDECPVRIGLRIEDEFRLDAGAIIGGARLLGDRNPLHNDPDAAARTHFGSLIACGPHAAGLHACMLPTYVTGLGFGVVGVDFTIRYLRPVLPDVDHTMWWTVDDTEVRGRNWQVSWSGGVEANGARCIGATGLILILGP